MIAKCQIAKLNAPLNWWLRHDASGVGNRRCDSCDCLHAFPARGAALIEIHDVTDRNQRPNQAEQVHVEFRELTNCDLSAHGQRHAGPDNQHEAKADQKHHQRPHQRVDAHEAEVLLCVFPIESIKGFDLRVLLRVCAHDANAGEVFLRARGDLRKEILNLLKPRMHLLAEELHSQRHQRHRDEEQQGQLPTD